MEKLLVFTNGEKIGDGIIKLPLLHEIRRRLKDYEIVWMTDKGSTVYNGILKNIANQYIDKIFEKADLNPFFWQNISDNYDLNKLKFNYVLDTQKAVIRTIALKRIKCFKFISATANGFFSDKKIKKKFNKKIRQYYLEDIFNLLDLINEEKVDKDFKINQLHGIGDNKKKDEKDKKEKSQFGPDGGEEVQPREEQAGGAPVPEEEEALRAAD